MDSMTLTISGLSTRAGKPLYASGEFFQGVNPDTPDSIDYKVEDVGTGDLLRDWTPSAVGTTTSFILEDQDVAMIVATDFRENRLVTMRAIQGATTLLATGTYLVTNFGYQSIIINLGCDMSAQLERYLPLPSSRISRNVDLDNWNP